MHISTTNTSHWIEGTNTEIRVEFDDDAVAEAAKWSGADEKMLNRCFWRLIQDNWDKVQGDSVTFQVSREDVVKLVELLREIDGQPN